jgi:multimeric flavodoxin WrbA
MQMKAIAIFGSRNPKGQTAQATDNLLDTMTAKGIQFEKFFLPAMKFELCRQCEDTGWGICKSEGQCTIKDDFGMLVDKIRKSDIVIFATPVYFSDLSESMKSFLDRLRRICMNESGQNGIKDKIAVGICVAGGGGGGSPKCIFNLENILTRCGFDVMDFIPVRRQNAELKTSVLKATGEWLADKMQN